jgi:glycine cleavage system H lipoate-binding protein
MVALFVLATIAVFLIADLIVVHARKRHPVGGIAPVAAEAPVLQPHRVPAGVFLSPSHLWLTIEPSGRVKVGLDELAQRLLGPLDVVRFPSVGRRVSRGETLFSVQMGEAELPIASPVSGVLHATQVPNGGMVSEGTDPDAWLVSIEPERMGEEIRPLRLAEEAASWLATEFARLRDTLLGLQLRPAATLPDGGEPAAGLLRILEAKDRDAVLKGFLLRDS